MQDARMRVNDAHAHLFSRRWFEAFFERSPRFTPDDPLDEMAAILGFELPDADPVALADRWVGEMDRHGVARMVLLMSHPSDLDSVRQAVAAHPDRFIGYAMVNPTEDSARDTVHDAFDLAAMGGLCLFPALHHFRVDDPAAYPVYEEAAAFERPVFVHTGQLRIPVFAKLAIPDPVDLSFSDPGQLRTVAGDFADVTFVLPHFGCGRFDEALELARECPNVVFDTSSSNGWIEPPDTLEDVYRRALDVVGPERILFGTDSSAFPRGWRHDIYELQLGVIERLGLGDDECNAILRGNLDRICPPRS